MGKQGKWELFKKKKLELYNSKVQHLKWKMYCLGCRGMRKG